MPSHDRPRGRADLAEDCPQAADPRDHRDRDLAQRLARLADGHPSAWLPADRAEWWRTPAADELDDWAAEQDEAPEDEDNAAGESEAGQDDAAGQPDDADPGDAEADGLAGSRLGAGGQAARGTRRTGASAEWADASAHSPYRPWFSADTAGDPWFAAAPGGATGGPGG
ncbi:MAG TPA: hypothetical protein VMA32_11120 [Streptosporangiaceae bacterium]|nr:hypothetical protein [Streptosporangiaceae bacterium]